MGNGKVSIFLKQTLRQICDVDMSVFDDMEQEREMFTLRLEELKMYI